MRSPSFSVPGTVERIRDIKSKAGEIFAYGISIAAMGTTIEVQTRDLKIAQQVNVGDEVDAVGSMKSRNYSVDLEVTEFKVLKAVKSAAPVKAP